MFVVHSNYLWQHPEHLSVIWLINRFIHCLFSCKKNIDFLRRFKFLFILNKKILVFQKVFIVCLLAIGAVSADVSHLQGGSDGYDYPVPSVRLAEPDNNYLPPVAPRKLFNLWLLSHKRWVCLLQYFELLSKVFEKLDQFRH